MSLGEELFHCLLILGRVCVGSVMIYSGSQLLRGEGLLSYSTFDSTITGIFVILLGVYAVFSGLVVQLFDYIQNRNQ